MSVPSRSSLDVSVVTGESMPIDVEPGRALARPMHEAAPVTNMPECEAAIAPATIEAARRAAEGVGDEHLRRAITVALEAVSAQPAKGPPDGPPVNPKK